MNTDLSSDFSHDCSLLAKILIFASDEMKAYVSILETKLVFCHSCCKRKTLPGLNMQPNVMYHSNLSNHALFLQCHCQICQRNITANDIQTAHITLSNFPPTHWHGGLRESSLKAHNRGTVLAGVHVECWYFRGEGWGCVFQVRRRCFVFFFLGGGGGSVVGESF